MTKLTEEAKEQIKAELLKTGETVSKEAVEMVFKLVEIVVKDTENKFDDMILPVVPAIKEYVLKLLDGISEEVQETF